MTDALPDRLTPDLRQALARAAEDARGRGHGHLGTAHLLMGVLGVPYAPGGAALGSLGVLLHHVDVEIVRVAGYGRGGAAADPGPVDAQDVAGPPDLPRPRWFRRGTPLPTSDAAAAALRHAGEVGGDAVHTGHLVLGLLASPGGLAHRILADHDVTGERVRALLPLRDHRRQSDDHSSQ
ncbi:MAG: Clp protease N-terminal domain-containing protein [Pseudonocardia sp.]